MDEAERLMSESDDNATSQPASAPHHRNNATLLGEVAWIMLHVNKRRGLYLWDFARLVTPAIGLRQFRLYYDRTVPIAYVSWAFLSAETEARFLADATALRPEDWASGERAYIVDFVAQQGAIAKIAPLLRRDPLLRAHRIKAVRRRSGQPRVIELGSGERGRRPISVGTAASGDTPAAAMSSAPQAEVTLAP
jgi:hemolysin-activating ACP:hemolysin acyltransferase